MTSMASKAFSTTSIAALCSALIDAFPSGKFDLLSAYAETVPVTARAGGRVGAALPGIARELAAPVLRWRSA